MIRHYITIAFRTLWRSKLHTTINVLGLGLGIACCVLIALFVKDEWTFDTFHSKADRIYRVFVKENWGENQEFFNTVTPFPMGPTLKENFHEIEKQVRFAKANVQVKVGNDQYREALTIGGQDFFDVFDFDVLQGNTEKALASQSGLVISDWVAEKYFGKSDPINQVISIQLGETPEDFSEFTVSAVVHVPTNSSIQFYLLASDLNFSRLYSQQRLTSGWFSVEPETYVLIQPGTAPSQLETKFPALFKTILGDEEFKKSGYQPGLQPLTDIHLNTSYPVGLAQVNNPRYSYILAAIAILILAVACINFVTLAVGRSIRRSKEVGIRKVVGAAKQQILTQFIGEALLVTFIGLALGLTAAFLALPSFNDLAGKQLVFPFDFFLLALVLVLLITIGLFSGSYPAFILSAYKPVSILKGVGSGNTRQSMRKVLVSIQLVLSVFLISSTLLMREQLEFIQNKNLGFNKEQVAVVQLNVPRGGRLAERVKRGFEMAEQFKQELGKFPDVASVCGSSHDFGDGDWVNIGYTDDKGTYRTFNINVIDDAYLKTLNIELAQGRNFSDDNPADARRSILVNEAFVKEYGWTDAIGKRIPGKGFLEHEIIGVVKDFNYTSLYNKIQPLVMVQNVAIVLAGSENVNVDNSPLPKLMIRMRPGNMANTIEQVTQTWSKIAGDQEFVMTFVDQALAAQYRSDQNLGQIIMLATVLAVVIGSLGLYALASLALQNRTKEVSIRKVMGASEQSLLILLSRDFLILVLISLVLSIPITIWLMQNWLSTFEYRIAIGWEVFALAGFLALTIAMLTISYHTIKTAMAQPAETLKCE